MNEIPEWVKVRLNNMGWAVITEWSASNDLGNTYLLEHKSGYNTRIQAKCGAAFLHGLEAALYIKGKE